MQKRIEFKNTKDQTLIGILELPAPQAPVVVFSHGLNSGKDSPRNKQIAAELNKHKIATFLIDFSGHGESEGKLEETTPDDMAEDIECAVRVLKEENVDLKRLGISGSSLGGIVALLSSVSPKTFVFRSVPWEGYYELAATLNIPSLFIVGKDDDIVGEQTEEFLKSITCEHKLIKIKGANHIFEGHIEEMIKHTVDWFVKHLENE